MEKIVCLSLSLSNFPSRQPFSFEISTKKPFQDSPHPKKGKLSLAFYWKWHRITWWFPSSRCQIFVEVSFFLNQIFLDPVLGVCGMRGFWPSFFFVLFFWGGFMSMLCPLFLCKGAFFGGWSLGQEELDGLTPPDFEESHPQGEIATQSSNHWGFRVSHEKMVSYWYRLVR